MLVSVQPSAVGLKRFRYVVGVRYDLFTEGCRAYLRRP